MTKITFIFPAVGHRIGEAYLRSWQMEPLPIATLAGLTPKDITVRFFDDRLERIDYDEPTDAVAISVETYTAKRAYQIASEYRKRNVPVLLGGFHTTLLPQEAARYGDVIITGEAESVWQEVMDDLKHRQLKSAYQGIQTDLTTIRVDRSIFNGKRYLPIGLVETGRGCRFPCEFCAIQTFYQRNYRRRPPEAVLDELARIKHQKKLFFFVDDNFAGDIQQTRSWLSELATLRIRWVTQMSIHAAHDESFVQALAAAGCKGVLIGFESLNQHNLTLMKKQFNTMRGGFSVALANLRKHGIPVYGTFVFGYEHDHIGSFNEAVGFAIQESMYVAAFNHLLPFPGTALYKRLQEDNRLLFESWWLDDHYRYNDLAFLPKQLTPMEVTQGCLQARKKFYRWRSILQRSWRNRGDLFMLMNYLPINLMHRHEVAIRHAYPLGDVSWKGDLLEVQ